MDWHTHNNLFVCSLIYMVVGIFSFCWLCSSFMSHSTELCLMPFDCHAARLQRFRSSSVSGSFATALLTAPGPRLPTVRPVPPWEWRRPPCHRPLRPPPPATSTAQATASPTSSSLPAPASGKESPTVGGVFSSPPVPLPYPFLLKPWCCLVSV